MASAVVATAVGRRRQEHQARDDVGGGCRGQVREGVSRRVRSGEETSAAPTRLGGGGAVDARGGTRDGGGDEGFAT